MTVCSFSEMCNVLSSPLSSGGSSWEVGKQRKTRALGNGLFTAPQHSVDVKRLPVPSAAWRGRTQLQPRPVFALASPRRGSRLETWRGLSCWERPTGGDSDSVPRHQLIRTHKQDPQDALKSEKMPEILQAFVVPSRALPTAGEATL